MQMQEVNRINMKHWEELQRISNIDCYEVVIRKMDE